MPVNFEFKAKAGDLAAMEQKLSQLRPVFIGEDHQVDTYFNVQQGRLKLREGNIENALIWYERPDTTGPKKSDVLLHQHIPSSMLKEILTRVHGIKAVVDKSRRIYFIENVKFHFDTVKGLGTFIEVEAIDKTGELGLEKITAQCEYYARLLGVGPEDYIAVSYSDMVLTRQSQPERIKLTGLTTPV